MADRSRSLLHKHDDKASSADAKKRKKSSRGPSMPFALYRKDIKRLAKSTKKDLDKGLKKLKKAAKKDDKRAKKDAKLERKLLKTKPASSAEPTAAAPAVQIGGHRRPAAGRPAAAPLTRTRPAVADVELETAEDVDLEAHAEAELETDEFATADGADDDAQDDADAEAARRAAGVDDESADADAEDEAEADVDAGTGSGGANDIDDEFERLLSGGKKSFSSDRGKARSFLADDDHDGPEAKTDAAAQTDETGADKPGAAGATAEPERAATSVGAMCRAVAVWWKVLTPSAGALDVADLKWLGAHLQPAQWGELETVAAAEHKRLVATIRDDNSLDVTDAGVLMQTVDGKAEPLPVDADGNPLAPQKAELIGDPEAQAKALVDLRGGKVYRASKAEVKGDVVDTSASTTALGSRGYESIVVDTDGKIYLTAEKPGETGPDLVADNNTTMRGEVKIVRGVITALSNRSRPTPDDDTGLRAALGVLQKAGIPVTFRVTEVSADEVTTGAELLAKAEEAKVEAVKDVSPKTLETLQKVPAWREIADEVGEAELAAIIDKRGWTGTGTEILDESGEPVDPALARSLLKTELQAVVKPDDATKAKTALAAP